MSASLPSSPFATFDGVLCDRVAPASFPLLRLRFRNQRWAERVGLGELDDLAWASHFGAFDPLPGNLDAPRAMRYHGHQFGVYNPDLGDGRGFLFAQLRDDRGRLLDLGTKGSGRTPWSRLGDGKLTLKGGVREVLATEMLEALGVETSKSFSLFETGQPLMRNDEPSPTRSSVLVRLSHSHVRFGTFQRLAHEGDAATMMRLVDHLVEHFYPELASAPDVPRALVAAITSRMGALAASWTLAGFVHGVLNTDNMNVNGESFDYGPWRFLPHLDPGFTAAYFDHDGRYAFGRQAEVLRWNLMRLCDALRLVAPTTALVDAISGFDAAHDHALGDRACFRLGIRPGDPDLDAHLASTVLAFLQQSRVSFDGFFFDWWRGPASADRALAGPRGVAYRDASFAPVRDLLDAYEPRCAGLAPPFDRDEPPTLVVDEVERLWEKIDRRDAWSAFDRKVDDLRALGAALACA